MDIKKLLENAVEDSYLIDMSEIPNIDLYMDQVTTFMETHLSKMKRNNDDKILTKTMINNYAKNDLLPSPDKKRYSKEHVLLLTLIYYFKNVLSISDVKKLLAPISENYFQGEKGKDMSYIYNELIRFEDTVLEAAKDDVNKKLDVAIEAFKDAPKKDADYLKLFSLISLLSFDVYVKKGIIESIIDNLPDPMSKEEREKAAKKAREAKVKEAKEKEAKKIKEEKLKQAKVKSTKA